VYRFALRPWWVVSHVLVVMAIVVMANLGFWQLRRLDEKRDRNAQLVARLSQPVEPLTELVPPGSGPDRVDDAVDRPVTATGRYRAGEQVLIRGRSLDDRPGSWVVVPLDLGNGVVVAVNRGWIRNDGRYTKVPDTYEVPSGEVGVFGIAHASQERGTLGATDPPGSRLDSLARVDLDRLDQQVEGELLPVWVQMTRAEATAPDPSPELLDPPDVDDEGPHLSYAIQWFIFATILAIGYPLVLRKVARDGGVRRRRDDDDEVGLDEPDPDDELEPDDPRLDTSIEP
jgi:cytochrome oxidase assembly protein ShyY1